MATLHWVETHPCPSAMRLREALEAWGERPSEEPGAPVAVVVAGHPDPALIPAQAAAVLWWVAEATPEAASEVLDLRPGWVLRQDQPLDAARSALARIRARELKDPGWLRQMLHLATLDELLRPILARAVRNAGARGGGIWIRQEDCYHQRCGEGFPEGPLAPAEAAALVDAGQAWVLCPESQVGILRLLDPQPGRDPFADWQQEAEYLLVNAWNLEVSQSLSFRDDLTVAFNRRCLEAELPQAIRGASVRGESVALLFLDVDNLKELNSLYGHPTGSRVIASVASVSKGMIRALDRIYRYGGDEFCILVPGSSTLGAAKLGERLIQALSQNPLQVGQDRIAVSISIGVASFPSDADGAEHLVEQADRALLRAKAEGKRRVVTAGD